MANRRSNSRKRKKDNYTSTEERFKKTGFRSGFEEKVAKDLQKKGIKYTFELDKIVFIQPSKKRYYKPDFFLDNGIFVETKGEFDLEDRKKMLLVIQQHPNLDIRLLFQNAKNKINKNSKTTYGDWCNKNNIKWAEGEKIPKSWINEKKK